MKCDELKPLVFSINDFAYVDEPAVQKNFENPHDHAVYKATEVDAAIAELKQKLHDAEMQADLAECDVTEYKIDYDKLNDENRKLKRALWLARAISAINAVGEIHNVIVCMRERHPKMSLSNTEAQEQIWKNVAHKCRAKAKEYK